MHDLNRIVVPKVAAEWEKVAYALHYKIPAVQCIRRNHNGDARGCCEELFEDWLTTSNGANPKIWQTLLDTLNEIEELASVTREITDQLIQMDSN